MLKHGPKPAVASTNPIPELRVGRVALPDPRGIIISQRAVFPPPRRVDDAHRRNITSFAERQPHGAAHALREDAGVGRVPYNDRFSNITTREPVHLTPEGGTPEPVVPGFQINSAGARRIHKTR